jgi:uncharacterized protein
MKIAVIGASGNAGARITAELARRGHAVTAVARNPDKITSLANVIPARGDAMDEADLTRLLRGHDAAISAIHFLASDPAKLIAAAKASGVGRYLVVGGAGSLEVAPGVRLVTTPGFPAQYKAEAQKGADFLDLLGREKTLNFRLGTDQLLTAADGKSWISFEDFAVALADEIEHPAHIRRRFTVGY